MPIVRAGLRSILRNRLAPALGLSLLAGLSAGPVTGDDRAVLTALYQATGGEQWIDAQGWLEADNSLCDWHGITCSSSEQGEELVTSIELAFNGLSGELPDLFDQFELLSRVDLSGNALTGPVPSSLINSLPVYNLSARAARLVDLSDNRLNRLPEFTRADGPGSGVRLDLSGNRLTAPLPDSWTDLQLRELNLARNPLGGEFPASWAELEQVSALNLAETGLSGPFPPWLSNLRQLHVLDLSGNSISGELPGWLAEFQLQALDLGGNLLTGPIGNAVAAMAIGGESALNLSNNAFSGEIPEELTGLSFAPANNTQGGISAPSRWGLDLCWNAFDPPTDGMTGFLDQFHHGGSYARCSDPRRPLDPTFSGSWYATERSGEGFAQMLLDNGQVLLYWFTHRIPAALQPESGEQVWFFGVADPDHDQVVFESMFINRGRFGQGGIERRAVRSDLRLSVSPLPDGSQQAAWSLRWFTSGGFSVVLANHFAGRDRQVALTRLAGSTCHNQHPDQWISGAWYNPERDGEGFVVEVNEDGRVIVYWFTFTPNDSGEQAWLIGERTGTILSDPPGTDIALVFNLLQPTGSVLGPDFEPEAIERDEWGELIMSFSDDQLTGSIQYTSNDPAYGSGSYPIERLARPRLVTCDG